jgi:hypothetical protein
MFSKSFFAAAALGLGALLAMPAPQAEAKTNVDIGIGIGTPYPGYYYYDGYRHRYNGYRYMRGATCGQASRVVWRAGFKNVRAVDCSRPIYGFRASKNGRPVMVNVNQRGNIVSVRRIYR